VPGDARGWSPPSGRCLERGDRYAWSVGAATAGGQLDWSSPFLFTVEEAPAAEEVAEAIATLERYLTASASAPSVDAAAADAAPRGATARASRDILPGSLTSPTTAIRNAAAASTPVLGSASLAVAGQVHLEDAGAVFKEDLIFLWDDAAGNLGLGRKALAAAVNGSGQNVAIGYEALRDAGDASRNTAIGYQALRVNTAFQNSALGDQALKQNSTGHRNTAIGFYALRQGTAGYRNTALGTRSGYLSTGHDNILINNNGSTAAAESHVLRIGQSTATGDPPFADFSLDKAFIHGIHGRTITSGSTVLVNSSGQLGTVSSSRRFKQDIQDLDEHVDRLLELRPVAFRFKQLVAADPDAPLEFGLIAEEVAEVFPELVNFDDQGRPESVQYHLLSALLLGEVKRLHERLEAVESQARPPRSRRPSRRTSIASARR
jgi:hypothetical protein